MKSKFEKFKFDLSWKLYNLGVTALIYLALPFVWYKDYMDKRRKK